MRPADLVDDNVLVIATTTTPFAIDAAVRDRFAQARLVAPPTSSDALADYWRFLAGEGPIDPDLDFARLGEASSGFTPAELSTI
jgi:transitional endoplasmic reticulum ATPase